MQISTVFFGVTLFGAANAHLLMALKSTWGLKSQGLRLESPLTHNTQNWFCHGATNDNNNVVEFTAGATHNIPIVCGEAISDPENGGEICSDDLNAYHG